MHRSAVEDIDQAGIAGPDHKQPRWSISYADKFSSKITELANIAKLKIDLN